MCAMNGTKPYVVSISAKHGIDFADAANVFDGLTITIEDTRFDYGETRFLTPGLLRTHVVVIVHTIGHALGDQQDLKVFAQHPVV